MAAARVQRTFFFFYYSLKSTTPQMLTAARACACGSAQYVQWGDIDTDTRADADDEELAAQSRACPSPLVPSFPSFCPPHSAACPYLPPFPASASK